MVPIACQGAGMSEGLLLMNASRSMAGSSPWTGCRYMTSKEQKLSAAVAEEMGQRVSAWLRRTYPRDGAKLLAQDFQVSPATTKRWFQGALPENRHMAMMASRWGKRFVAYVFEPVVGPWRDYGLDDELREVKARIARLEVDLEGSRSDQGHDGAPLPGAAHAAGQMARDARRALEGAPRAMEGRRP